MENLTTWVIASSVCVDERAFGWFMRYAADRMPVAEKVNLIGEIVQTLPDPTVIYDGFLDDLRQINRVRVRVAHSIVLPDQTYGQYVNIRKGLPDSISNDEMRAQVADALKRTARVVTAIQILQQAAPLRFPAPRVPRVD